MPRRMRRGRSRAEPSVRSGSNVYSGGNSSPAEEERRRLVLALEVAEQVGADGARVEEAIELDAGQLADLRLGVVGAALVTDPRPDLAHDLLDVNVISADGEIRHGLPATAR